MIEVENNQEPGKITASGIVALKKRIGLQVPSTRPAHEYASFDGIRNYTSGIGDKNPLYQDRCYAANTRWKGLIAHPTFVNYMGVSEKKKWTPEEKIIGKGGGLPGVHSMYSGEETEWFLPIYMGDRLTSKGGLANVEEKQSKTAGLSVHETYEVLLWNQRGELVAVRRALVIRYERDKSKERRSHLDIPLHHYTQEELDEIDNEYANEHIQGATPIFWEDVIVGEELPAIVKGPWSVTCFIMWAIGAGPRNEFYRAHALQYEYRKRHPAAFSLNDFGFHDIITRVHWDPAMATSIGQPTTYDQGGERIAALSHAVTNWMGDEGFLRKLQVSIRKFCYTGDCLHITGKVVDKYIKNGESHVELDMHATNQRGEDTAPSRALVLLPSRERGPVKMPACSNELKSIYL